MSEELFLKQVVPAYFLYQPDQEILRKRVKEITDLNFGYFYFNGKSKVEKSLLFEVEGEVFYKIIFESEILELRDKENELIVLSLLEDFKIEFYISYADRNGEFKNPVLMGVDELAYYLKKK